MSTEQLHGPSYDGAVMIDIGPGAGALVIHASAPLLGAEIEISPVDRDPRQDRPHLHVGSDHVHTHAPRTHVSVRERCLPSGTYYAAVFPSLAAGAYVVHGQDGAADRVVTVPEAAVTEITW